MQEIEYKALIKDIKELLNNICKDERVKYHKNPVEDITRKMTKELNADLQVVEISAYLHDITKITGERKNHHLTGAKFAEDFLKNYNIEKSKVEQIKNCLITHIGSFVFIRDTV